MALSRSIYMNELQPVIGVKKFLNSVNQNKLIGSNRDKHSLIQGLKLTKLKTYFEENNIFSFDMVSQPKPDPEIFLKALEDSKIHSNETIVIEDSVIGVEAAVNAQIKVIAITAGGHWINRSDNILKDAGAYFVASTFEQVIIVIEKL